MLLTRLDLKLHKPSAVLPLALEMQSVTPVVMAQRPASLVIEMRYELRADDGQGETVLSGAVHLAAVVFCAEQEWLEEMLPAIMRLTHDALRELLHHYTMVMGLPPLVLDVAVIPDAIPMQGSTNAAA